MWLAGISSFLEAMEAEDGFGICKQRQSGSNFSSCIGNFAQCFGQFTEYVCNFLDEQAAACPKTCDVQAVKLVNEQIGKSLTKLKKAVVQIAELF
jgi:hypothetical protein